MLLDGALRRLLARWAAEHRSAPPDDDVPELLEVERLAEVAMTACTCGHVWHLHEHPHVRTGCDACACERFRPAEPPRPLAPPPQPGAADAAVVRLRVALWTRAWRDR